MEPIVVIVGFLGAGKTTLLKWLMQKFVDDEWQPTLILNDYENANLDSQQFLSVLPSKYVKALSGSCICCSGLTELRNHINSIKRRKKGITFIEANGTTDAISLMEFLCVGLSDHFLPPTQISVVDVQKWQKRLEHNSLEANQVQVSSLVFLNHSEKVSIDALEQVKLQIESINPAVDFRNWKTLVTSDILGLDNLRREDSQFDHIKTHWSSASCPLPDRLPSIKLKEIIDKLPDTILRVKGCTRLDEDDYYSFFEKIPDAPDTIVRPYTGKLISGPTILIVGPGSQPQTLKNIVNPQ